MRVVSRLGIGKGFDYNKVDESDIHLIVASMEELEVQREKAIQEKRGSSSKRY